MKRIARLASCVGIVIAVAMTGTACGHDEHQPSSAPLADDSAAAIDKAITTVTTFNTELQPHIWEGAQLRPEVRKATLDMVDRLVRDSGIDGLTVDDVALVGSIASYEYNDTSDFDVHVFVHADGVAAQQLSASTALLSSNIEQRQEGRIHFYGLPVEVHFYAGAPEAERVPGAGTDGADAVSDRGRRPAASGRYRTVAGGEDQTMTSAEHDGGARRLSTRPLLDQQELTAGVVGTRFIEPDHDL